MKFALVSTLIALTPLPVLADAKSDAAYIVEQTINRSIFEGALIALRPVILSAVENDLRKEGITVSNVGSFMDIIMDEFMDGYVVIMQDKTLPYYLESFTDEQLSDIAAFYATDSGKTLISKTPELMQFGATTGATAGQAAMEQAKGRVRQRLIDENIDVTNGDKSMMQKLLDTLK
jgi:hypothetical protein